MYQEPEYPSLLFAKDGEIYNLANKKCLVIGGAYSVDKPIRVAEGMHWWADEQPSDEIKQRVEQRLDAENWAVDIVLSHTCPFKYMPWETFDYSAVNQRLVDNSTEKWLDTIESKLEYGCWYCGHFHVYKRIDRMCFLFGDFLSFVEDGNE